MTTAAAHRLSKVVESIPMYYIKSKYVGNTKVIRVLISLTNSMAPLLIVNSKPY